MIGQVSLLKEQMDKQQNELFGKRIGIYTGIGTSHSWLWFVDALERMGFDNLIFMDENALREEDGIKKVDALLLSGGDTFAIAEGMAEKGTRNLERFIGEGGIYFGSCAGAYLPLKSSQYPLSLLNLAGVKISNLSKLSPIALRHSEKFCTPYGCHYVFHPVRDEVKIRCSNGCFSRNKKEIKAPLYGGPCMEASADVIPLAFYQGFTDKTLFLVNEKLAEETVIGKMAVCCKMVDKGRLYLSGPHLEHPYYPEANQLLMEILYDGLKGKHIRYHDNEKDEEFKDCSGFLRELKMELSGARIIAFSLERELVTWLIGRKVYEPEKFRVFLDALWKRLGFLGKHSQRGISGEELRDLIVIAKVIKDRLKLLKTEIQNSSDTAGLVEEIISDLRKLSSSFMNLYFRMKRRQGR